jgi:hypothetical protein
MNLREKLAAGFMRAAAARMWGFPPNLMRDIVLHLGAGGGLKWFLSSMPRYEKAMKLLGPLRGHLICIEASLLNGCAYCTFAHAYAFELLYFHKKSTLFPLDEHQLTRLRNGSDEAVRAALIAALSEAGLPDEIAVVERVWQLKFDGVAARGAEDQLLRSLLEMFDVLNYCTIDGRTPLDLEAHDPINKDQALRLRYAEARLAQRG